MSSETEVIRRNNKGAKAKVKKSTRQNGDLTKQGRRNKRRDARNKQLALILSTIGLIVFLFLILRGRHQRIIGLDSERFARAKALRDAAVSSGKTLLRKTSKTLESVSRQAHHGRHHYDLKGEKVQGMRYLDPRQLPPLPGEPREHYKGRNTRGSFRGDGDDDWVPIAESLDKHSGPRVDYVSHKYKYPELVYEPKNDGTYPALEPMRKIFETWEQDDLDSPPDTLVEVLQHFDYQDPKQLEVSWQFILWFCSFTSYIQHLCLQPLF
jgi:hypothetical protein